VTRSIPERLAAAATGLAAGIVVIAISILPFLTPAWVSFEQGRAQAEAWTGFDQTELATATNAILHDLVVGPPSFDVTIGGQPVLQERERAHMRDVRGVFAEFSVLAAVAAIGLIALVIGAYRAGHPARAWRAIATGMRWLAVGVVIAGVIATFFFDAAFELFHELFFPSGSYNFDPRTDRLVQLFPFDFWSETTIVLGAVILAAAGVIWAVSRRLGRHPDAEMPDRSSAGATQQAPAELGR
jgi:integral membrane protein (TIGR01906 family)